MHKSIRLVSLAILLSILNACGSSSSDGGSSATADVQGEWDGSYTITGVPGSTAVTAVIKQGGFGFFYDANGVVYVLPTLNGNTTLTGTITAFAPLGYIFTDGHTQDQFNVSGTASDGSINGNFNGNGETGSFALSRFAPFSGTPSVIAGSWQGFYVGSGEAAVDITMNADGTFSGNDGNGCNITGAASLIGSGSNLISVTVHSTGASSTPGISCAGTLTGLGYESSTDAGIFGGAPGTYYYFGVANANSAFVAEFKAP